MWGQSNLIIGSLPPKRDWGPKRVISSTTKGWYQSQFDPERAVPCVRIVHDIYFYNTNKIYIPPVVVLVYHFMKLREPYHLWLLQLTAVVRLRIEDDLKGIEEAGSQE